MFKPVNSKETETIPASRILNPLWRLTCRSSPVLLNDKVLQHSRVFAIHGSPQQPEVWLHPIILHMTRVRFPQLNLFSSHRKNRFVARCERLNLIKKISQCSFAFCEFFVIRCKYSQRAANQFWRWLEKKLKTCRMIEWSQTYGRWG